MCDMSSLDLLLLPRSRDLRVGAGVFTNLGNDYILWLGNMSSVRASELLVGYGDPSLYDYDPRDVYKKVIEDYVDSKEMDDVSAIAEDLIEDVTYRTYDVRSGRLLGDSSWSAGVITDLGSYSGLYINVPGGGNSDSEPVEVIPSGVYVNFEDVIDDGSDRLSELTSIIAAKDVFVSPYDEQADRIPPLPRAAVEQYVAEFMEGELRDWAEGDAYSWLVEGLEDKGFVCDQKNVDGRLMTVCVLESDPYEMEDPETGRRVLARDVMEVRIRRP